VDIVFDNIELPFATIHVTNNANPTAFFRNAELQRLSQGGYYGIDSGRRESYEIRSIDDGLNLNLSMAQDQIVVRVRFEDDPDAATVTIENGYVYTISLNLKLGGNPDMASDYTAWLVKGSQINKGDLLISN
jgi:hypothetical protein